jgi:catechol 2,3-dioxygenase-like lactoylglutathione lyase family enzyme
MPVELNHTIVASRDALASATFVAEILGLPAPEVYGPFQVVQTANGVSLDFQQTDGKIAWQHYAFLISEPEFDEIFGRVKSRGLPHWADPFKNQPDQINHNDGGRGVYFEDPDGHMLEIITRPYGSGED